MNDNKPHPDSPETNTPPPTSSRPAKAVDLLLQRMAEMHDFPAVSKYIIEINEKAAPRSLTSAAQLAGIIIKDYSLTAKLLKMVNSALYSQFSGQIATVSRAVVILGFEQVRLSATSLIFFEHMQNKGQAEELKTAVLTSFLSGILARDLAEALRMKTTEEIFICAILHNFGKLMVMYYLPEHYADIKKQMEEEGLDENNATRQVLRNSYDEIGMAVAELWGLPSTIISGMKKLAPEELHKDEKVRPDFRTISCFANELYSLLARDVPLQEKKDSMQQLLKNFEKIIPFSRIRIEEMVDNANMKAKDFSFVLGLNSHQEKVLKHLSFKDKPGRQDKSALLKKEAAPPAPSLDLSAFQLNAKAEQKPGPPLAPEQQLVIMNGIRDITHSMLEENYNLDDVLNMVVETIYRGLSFARILIGIKNAKTNSIEARYGLGQYIDEVLRKFKFPIEEAKDIFNQSLAGKMDIFIPDTEEPSAEAALPSWYRGILKDKCFALLPIVVNNNCIGLIYADMKDNEETVTTEKLNYLKMLRDQIVLAIKQKSRKV